MLSRLFEKYVKQCIPYESPKGPPSQKPVPRLRFPQSFSPAYLYCATLSYAQAWKVFLVTK